MRELPILFQTEMVQSILAGRKDMTRRTRGLKEINENPDQWVIPHRFHCEKERLTNTGKIAMRNIETDTVLTLTCPYGKAGDVLWVREAFRKYFHVNEHGYTDFDKEIIDYVADNPEPINEVDGDGFAIYNKDGSEKFIPNRPSIHMPKEAARIWLKVVSVKAERAQDISEEDALREGIQFYVDDLGKRYKDYTANAKGYGDPQHDYPTVATAKESFRSLWISINGKESWNVNPWVWVIEYEVLSTTGKPNL